MNRQKKWQLAHPKARWAHNALRSAVKAGIVERQPCEECGEPKTDAHHDDYDKPAVVTWLCRKHHGAVHRKARLDGR